MKIQAFMLASETMRLCLSTAIKGLASIGLGLRNKGAYNLFTLLRLFTHENVQHH